MEFYPYYIINKTVQKASKDNIRCVMPHTEREWPTVETLQSYLANGFAKAGDVLELIEIKRTITYYSRVIPKINDQETAYGTERINSNATGYVSAKDKANDWLNEKIDPQNVVLPYPRCGLCRNRADMDKDKEMENLQSLADSGMCFLCRIENNNSIPKVKKKPK